MCRKRKRPLQATNPEFQRETFFFEKCFSEADHFPERNGETLKRCATWPLFSLSLCLSLSLIAAREKGGPFNGRMRGCIVSHEYYVHTTAIYVSGRSIAAFFVWFLFRLFLSGGPISLGPCCLHEAGRKCGPMDRTNDEKKEKNDIKKKNRKRAAIY